MKSKNSFEGFLIENHLLNAEAIQSVVVEARKANVSVSEYLQEKNLMSPEVLAKALARYYDCSYAAGPFSVRQEWVSKIPTFTLRRYKIIPLMGDGKKITVACVDPGNLLAIDEIRRVTGLKVELVCTTEAVILEALARSQTEKVEGDPSTGEKSPQQEGVAPQLVERILESAIRKGASDLHFEPQKNFAIIRERVDGILHEVERMKSDAFGPVVSRVKYLAGMDIVEKRLAQDGRFKSGPSEVRASTLPTIYGEKLVLRILRSGDDQPSLEKLGLDEPRLKLLHSICDASEGLVLVAGPTGSGKSTTLYALLSSLDRKTLNLITIEDPVEYELELANQVQINAKIGNTFASMLPVILRQDPDILLIGELRDEKTAQMCMRAAMSGHLVFSTVHAPSALATITRLSDMGIAPHLIVSSLRASLSQRLLRKLCDDCKEPYEASAEEKKLLGVVENRVTLYAAKGCPNCYQLGYRGRMAAIEVLLITDPLRECILKRERKHLAQLAKAEGFYSIWENGVQKVLSGSTTLKELMAQCG